MEKKIIVKASSGLGDQMFMYAYAFALSKELNYKLYIDDTSAYFQKKNRTFYRKYGLHYFNLNAPTIEKKYKFDNLYKHNKKKVFKLIDKFRNKKKFLQEHVNKDKKTFYKKYDIRFANNIYIEGGFRSEKYFSDYKNSLISEFTIKDIFIKSKNKYIDLLKKSNSVSIHIRRNRFVEPSNFSDKSGGVVKNISLDEIFKYIYKAVTYFENKIEKPKFFVWSNNFNDLQKIFDINKFIFIENNDFITDFYLFNFVKHFIVSPSSYHWWGAWLNTNKNKICTRPSDFLNSSNNSDFWPQSWQKID